MVKTKRDLTFSEFCRRKVSTLGECQCEGCNEYRAGYRQALFDAAKELSDHGHLLAAQRLIDAANED